MMAVRRFPRYIIAQVDNKRASTAVHTHVVCYYYSTVSIYTRQQFRIVIVKSISVVASRIITCVYTRQVKKSSVCELFLALKEKLKIKSNLAKKKSRSFETCWSERRRRRVVLDHYCNNTWRNIKCIQSWIHPIVDDSRFLGQQKGDQDEQSFSQKLSFLYFLSRRRAYLIDLSTYLGEKTAAQPFRFVFISFSQSIYQ